VEWGRVWVEMIANRVPDGSLLPRQSPSQWPLQATSRHGDGTQRARLSYFTPSPWLLT